MTRKFSKELIEEIYKEAEKDIIFFSYASSFVNDNEDYSNENNDVEIFQRTLELISFLSETGDFKLGRMLNVEGVIKFTEYENAMIDFELDARRYMKYEGLRCDALSWELALSKI